MKHTVARVDTRGPQFMVMHDRVLTNYQCPACRKTWSGQAPDRCPGCGFLLGGPLDLRKTWVA